MLYEVYFCGLLVGAVRGKDRLDARDMARKYFPDATSLGFFYGHPDLVWINESFALFNYDQILA